MKKSWICIILALALLTGCAGAAEPTTPITPTTPTITTEPIQTTIPEALADPDTVVIALEDDTLHVEDGAGVYAANDIIYYESGHDFTYGEGEPGDEHDPAEAAAHTVIHITRPGTYRISGTLSAGQIAVDLGEGAEDDPGAVVTLILDGLDITCTVAPAIIFYNVYACGGTGTDKTTASVDTSTAGANVIIADGSVNTVNGSYVAKIYKPDSVVLSEDGTEVEDAKKLHKYDGAFYSKMTLNIYGGEAGDGSLTINAENEGLDSELHLTIHGGNIRINSGNDGINTNEDGVSVTTINGGNLEIFVNGSTGEGDGIDSNGYLVINGGTVTAQACGFSGDAGIDSDMGIYLNGGTVMASGNMLDRIAGGYATYAVFQFSRGQTGSVYTLKNEAGEAVLRDAPENSFTYLILSSPDLQPGTYTLWQDDTQLSVAATGGFGMGHGGFRPDGQIPDRPEGEIPTMPEGGWPEGEMPTMPEGSWPEGEMPSMPEGDRPEGEMPTMPEGGWPEGEMPTMPEGGPPDGFGPGMGRPGGMQGGGQQMEGTDTLTIVEGGNEFYVEG